MSELSLEAMNDVVQEHCDKQDFNGSDCGNCAVEGICQTIGGAFGEPGYEKETKQAFEIIMKLNGKEVPEDKEDKEDLVNHPNHYTQGGMECIDEMLLIFGKEAVEHFCLLNCWKYRKRALHKNGQQDLDKSDWYLKKYRELKYGTEV